MDQPELMESQFHCPCGLIFHHNFDFQFLRLTELPARFCLTSLRVLNAQGLNTHRVGRLHMKCIFTANDQGAFLCGRNAPVSRTRGPQVKVWAVKRLESPIPVQCASDFRVELRRIESMGIHLKSPPSDCSPTPTIPLASCFPLYTHHKIVA